MRLPKTFKKILFFWIIFHSVAYFCYLAEIHPHNNYETINNVDLFGKTLSSTTQHTNYYLVPESTKQEENEKFYPFHDFIEESWGGGYTYSKFVGIFGYYGIYEYLLYVILPLFVIGVIWVYRKFISPVPTSLEHKREIKPQEVKSTEPKVKREVGDGTLVLFIILITMLIFGIAQGSK